MDAADQPPPPAWHATAGGGTYRAVRESGLADGVSLHARLGRGLWGVELGGRYNLRPEHLSGEEEVLALFAPSDTRAMVPLASTESWSGRVMARLGPDGPRADATGAGRRVWGGPFLVAGGEVRSVQDLFVDVTDDQEVVVESPGETRIGLGPVAGVGFGARFGPYAGLRVLALDHLHLESGSPEQVWSLEVALELPLWTLEGR